jgi:transcriptional regulator with XRE-family HTH domain
MDMELKAIYIKVKELLQGNELPVILARIQMETDKQEEEFTFGHTFSRNSYMKFEKAINSKAKDQKENFIRYLKRLMMEREVTNKMLADRSRIEESSISKYLKGTRRPNGNKVLRIVLALHLELLEAEDLLRKSGMMFQEEEKIAVILEAIRQRIYYIDKVEAVLRKLTNGKQSLFSEKERREMGDADELWEIEIND